MTDPANGVLPINRPVRIVTRDRETITGRRLNEDTYSVQLIDSDERLRSILKSDMREYELGTSVMQPTTLTPDEIADVIGYLLTLQGVR